MDKVEIALMVFNFLTIIAAATPTEKDDRVLGRIKNLLDKIKLNHKL